MLENARPGAVGRALVPERMSRIRLTLAGR